VRLGEGRIEVGRRSFYRRNWSEGSELFRIGPAPRCYSQKLPPEYQCVNRVGPRPQYCQCCAYQDGDDEVKYILSSSDPKSAELHETAKRCAKRGHEAEAKAHNCQNDGDESPERCHEGPASRPVDEECCSHSESQDEQRSAWRPQRKHGEQSLHSRELTLNGLAEQSRLSSA